MVKVYHYTSKEGYEAIKKSKMIKASRGQGGRDIACGEGVYFTSLAPKNRTKQEIALNNYDGTTANTGMLDKVAFWFEFDIPEGQVIDFTANMGRSVWVLPNKDLTFDDYPPCNQGDFNSFTKMPSKMPASETELLGLLIALGLGQGAVFLSKLAARQ